MAELMGHQIETFPPPPPHLSINQEITNTCTTSFEAKQIKRITKKLHAVNINVSVLSCNKDSFH